MYKFFESFRTSKLGGCNDEVAALQSAKKNSRINLKLHLLLFTEF